MMALPALLVALTALLPAVQAYVPSSAPSYAQLAPFATQWLITMSKRNTKTNATFTPHTCNATALGNPCNQPPLQQNSDMQVKISFAKRNVSAALQTWQNGVPVEFVVRLDYAPSVAVDRGWRKKNGAWPGYGRHAKWVVATLPFNEAGGSAVWDLNKVDEVTDAVLYPEVCVKCKLPSGKVDFCQCTRRNNALNGTFNFLSIETEVMSDDIPPSMRAASIAMAVFCPLFLIVYAISDWLYYKRTGKALALY